ncbi:MAG: alpha/beta hydrolase [Lentisphaeria bacterium]|nr:alpha/beta hydrolase [Lentisphaeria bacterium]
MKKYPKLTPETAEFIEALEAKGGPPLYDLSYEDARAVLASAQSGPAPRPEADVTDLDIPFGADGRVELRIIRPKGQGGVLPVVLYIHGGGWVMGDKSTHDRLVREIAAGTGAAVVYVNYTPSPEAQYPVPTQQIMTALRYVVAHAEELKLDPERIAVAGDSVGGNMAAALTLMCKAEHGPRLCFQLLLYPVTDASFDTDSYREFAEGPWLTKKAMEYFWDAYAPDKAVRSEILASPLRASEEELQGLPPAFVVTDANDVLRDEGEAYAVKLMNAGVPAGFVRYGGTIHDFLMLDAVAETLPAKEALAQACMVLRKALR